VGLFVVGKIRLAVVQHLSELCLDFVVAVVQLVQCYPVVGRSFAAGLVGQLGSPRLLGFCLSFGRLDLCPFFRIGPGRLVELVAVACFVACYGACFGASFVACFVACFVVDLVPCFVVGLVPCFVVGLVAGFVVVVVACFVVDPVARFAVGFVVADFVVVDFELDRVVVVVVVVVAFEVEVEVEVVAVEVEVEVVAVGCFVVGLVACFAVGFVAVVGFGFVGSFWLMKVKSFFHPLLLVCFNCYFCRVAVGIYRQDRSVEQKTNLALGLY
jgi:hypothetical protein